MNTGVSRGWARRSSFSINTRYLLYKNLYIRKAALLYIKRVIQKVIDKGEEPAY